jgi:hypothetical protein
MEGFLGNAERVSVGVGTKLNPAQPWVRELNCREVHNLL